MVQSLNTKVDLVIDATAFTGLADYGKIMIGDKGFEFYNSRDPHKYMQSERRKMVPILFLLKKQKKCFVLFEIMLIQIIWFIL